MNNLLKKKKHYKKFYIVLKNISKLNLRLLDAYQRAEAGIGKPDPSASDSLENDDE